MPENLSEKQKLERERFPECNNCVLEFEPKFEFATCMTCHKGSNYKAKTEIVPS